MPWGTAARVCILLPAAPASLACSAPACRSATPLVPVSRPSRRRESADAIQGDGLLPIDRDTQALDGARSAPGCCRPARRRPRPVARRSDAPCRWHRHFRSWAAFSSEAGCPEYAMVATSWLPAPAARSIAVAPGARLTMRRGGCADRDIVSEVIRNSNVCRMGAASTMDAQLSGKQNGMQSRKRCNARSNLSSFRRRPSLQPNALWAAASWRASESAVSRSTQRHSSCSGLPSSGLTGKVIFSVRVAAT